MSHKRLVITRSGLSREGCFYGHTQTETSALCQQQTLAYQESCRDVFSSTLVTLE